MAKGKRRKQRPRKRIETETYADPEGNALTLRKALSPATVAHINQESPASAAAAIDDAWQRREELLFERLAVGWEIAGMPIEGEKMLLGRFRMATDSERRWIRGVIREHLDTWIPGL